MFSRSTTKILKTIEANWLDISYLTNVTFTINHYSDLKTLNTYENFKCSFLQYQQNIINMTSVYYIKSYE